MKTQKIPMLITLLSYQVLYYIHRSNRDADV